MSEQRGPIVTVTPLPALCEPLAVAGEAGGMTLADWLDLTTGDQAGGGSHRRHWLSSAPAWAILLLDEAVVFGTVGASGIDLDPTIASPVTLARLQDARVFNRHGEIHLWRGGDGRLRARGRRDTAPAGSPTVPTIDEAWYLWGTRVDPAASRPGWTVVTEDAGTTLRVPVEVGDGRAELPLRLLVRHYLEEADDLGLPTYGDMRFVSLATRAGSFSDGPLGAAVGVPS